MASNSESRLPQLGQGKRRSFLPAPSKLTSAPQKQPEATPPRDETFYPKFKVGDRICISGVKHGILRYLGDVHIATGTWCGIELDDPDGKHDGEVDGRRYFFCRKRHGVFAPYDKVDLIEPVDVPATTIEVGDNALKRRSLPRPSSGLPKAALGSRPISAGSLGDVRKQVDDVREVAESVVTSAEKGKEVLPPKSQITKLSGIPRTGVVPSFPPSQLKQQAGSELRYKKDLTQKDTDVTQTDVTQKDLTQSDISVKPTAPIGVKSVFSNLISTTSDKQSLSADIKEPAVKPTPVPPDPVAKQQKPSRLPGASRLPTKFSKLERPSPTEPKPPPSEVVKAEEVRMENAKPSQMSRTFVSNTQTNETFDAEEKGEDADPVNQAEGNEDDENRDLTSKLRSDSRQFLNITFDAENNLSPPSLPDVVSSASQSPDSTNGSHCDIEKDSQTTKGNTDDASLDLLDDDMWDNTDLESDLDRVETKMAEDRLKSVVDGPPIVASTPLPAGRKSRISAGDSLDIDDNDKTGSSIKDLFPKIQGDANLNATFNLDEDDNESSAQSLGKCDLIESSLNSGADSSLNEHVPEQTFLVEKGITDITMPMEEMEQIKELDKTKVEDILEGMSKSVVMDLEKALETDEKAMIDSGIMDPVTLNRRSLTETAMVYNVQEVNRKSMTESGFHDLVKGESKPMIDSGISLGLMTKSQQSDMDGSMIKSQQLEMDGSMVKSEQDLDEQLRLEADLKAGHAKKERPISLISTTSADTGYVPDTDSEAGTLTTTSPLDWMEKHGSVEPVLSSVQEQEDSYKESFSIEAERIIKEVDVDSDNYSDIGAPRTDTDTGRGESDLEDTHQPVHEGDISGLSPLNETTQGACAQTGSPSSINSSLIEDDRAEADQIQQSDKGGNQSSSAENTLKDLSDASPDGIEMPLEESVISGDVTLSSQGETTVNLSDTANQSASQDVSITSASVNNTERGGDTSAIVSEKSETKDSDSSKTPAKGKSATTPASRKKSVDKIEHKKPNLKVKSSIADYIRTPVPTKPKEEKGEDTKAKKNVVNKKRADNSKSDSGKSPENSEQKDEDGKRIRPKIEKEPPKLIKRTPPKSKWDNIMSQIDPSKAPKPKPKSEIKSKLEAYLSTPAPAVPKKEREPKKETKPRSTLVSIPKPDYSKVKSKLSLATPPPKRDLSPSVSKNSPRNKSPARASRASNGNIILDLSESFDNTSARSSRTDLSVDHTDNGTDSLNDSRPRTPRESGSRMSSIKSDRPASVTSNLSEGSQASVKIQNAKNKKSELPKSETPRKKFSNVKSSIPPPAPKKAASPKTTPKKSTESSKPDVSKTTPKKPGNPNRSSRTLRTPNKSNNHLKNSHQPDIVSNSIRTTSDKEISRLETLCETRTKELNLVKMQLKNTTQGFDAMTVLVRYLTQELDAFSCPVKTEKLQHAEAELAKARTSIADLESLKSRLEGEISELTKTHSESTAEIGKLQEDILSLKESHELAVAQLTQEHEAGIKYKKDSLEKLNRENLTRAKEHHEHVVSYMKDCHDRNISDINLDHQRAIDSLRLSHLEDIEKLRTKHDNQMEELHKQHRDKLEDITYRFETIKTTLGEKVETLRGECEDLKCRARNSEEALLRDSDVKLQMALQPFQSLPAEIESLKLVIEMRNEEVTKLRKHNMELEKQLEELPIAKEKIASLQQKVENLEAIINIKTDHEKQLHEKCVNLMRKYDKESKANKRLSMDYEQLIWKMDQEFGSTESLYRRQVSHSPTRSECSSPDLTRKGLSPIISETDSPSRRSRKSTSSADDSFERKLKRRSATFLLEKERNSPSASPQAKRLSPSSFENTPPKAMSQSACELTYSVSPAPSSPPDSSSPSVSVSQSMSQSMEQSMTDSDIFGDFESSGIVMNGQEISVSLTLPESKEEDSEVFTEEKPSESPEKKTEKVESQV